MFFVWYKRLWAASCSGQNSGIYLSCCSSRLDWVGRHWAFLISVLGRAVFGFLWVSFVMARMSYSLPGAALIAALIVASAAGQVGLALLRKIERDGRDERTSWAAMTHTCDGC